MSAELMRKLELMLVEKKQAKALTVDPSAPEGDHAQAPAIGSTPTNVGDENPPPIVEPIIAPLEDVMKDPSEGVSARKEMPTERA